MTSKYTRLDEQRLRRMRHESIRLHTTIGVIEDTLQNANAELEEQRAKDKASLDLLASHGDATNRKGR